jgi:hypothetical protein
MAEGDIFQMALLANCIERNVADIPNRFMSVIVARAG